MIYTCTDGQSALNPAAPSAVRRKGACLCVDIHCHYHNYSVDEKYAGLDRSSIPYKNKAIARRTIEINEKQEADIIPKMRDIDVRLAEMDRMGIDVQAISPATEQYYYWTDPEVGRATSRDVNDGIAELITQQPDRLVGFGTLPLQHPEFAIAELDRIVGTMGFKGVEIGSNVNGVTVADPSLGLEKVFARIEELGVMAFMHPRPFNGGARFGAFHMSNTIGQPLDSTVAVTQLIFEGVLQRLPDLKLCIAHAGGYLPFYHGRMDHAYAVRAECQDTLNAKPSSFLHQLYFDAMTFDGEMLRYLIDRYGADHVLLGTDYPYDMGINDPVLQLDGYEMISETERLLIKGQNAARLLGLEMIRPG